MGNTAQVVVTGARNADRLLDLARQRIIDLEACWSRFLLDSEISRLNGRPSQPTELSPDTYTLVACAVAAWQATGGRYDPTVLPTLRSLGYDRDFAAVTAHAQPPPPPVTCGPAPGCGLVDLDPATRTVTLPADVEIDPGGIGKGLAADLVTAELIAEGAAGALVNLGGDLRVRGHPPDADTWSIAIQHPLRSDRPLLTLGLPDGGVATSSRLRRRWHQHGTPRHHLIDPHTGQPTDNHLVAATAIAPHAWLAEATTKAVLVTGQPASHTPVDGILLATVDVDGRLELTPDLAQALA